MAEGVSLRERQGEDEGDSVDLWELWRSAAVAADRHPAAGACVGLIPMPRIEYNTARTYSEHREVAPRVVQTVTVQ